MPDDTRPLVLIVLAGGGWYRETLRLVEAFDSQKVRVAYAYAMHQHHACGRLPMPLPGERYPIHHLGRTQGRPWRHLVNVLWLGRGFVEAWRLIRRLRPAAVLVLGSAAAVPLFAAGKLLGVRCVFVETVTRVRRLSRTGRLLHALGLSDRLYVQWPGLAEVYPGSRFAGAVV